MSKERDVAEQILQHIGGKENVVSAEHCATRLRLILKDDSRFDKKQIEAIDGVKGSFKAAVSIRSSWAPALLIRSMHSSWRLLTSRRGS